MEQGVLTVLLVRSTGVQLSVIAALKSVYSNKMATSIKIRNVAEVINNGNGGENAIEVELGTEGKENMMECRESTVRTLLIPQPPKQDF